MSDASRTRTDLNEQQVDATLDAGAQNCATLILNVRKALAPLAPGRVLQVIAYDPSAELDLHAWSRMTGHRYLGMEKHDSHAVYYVRKREDSHG